MGGGGGAVVSKRSFGRGRRPSFSVFYFCGLPLDSIETKPPPPQTLCAHIWRGRRDTFCRCPLANVTSRMPPAKWGDFCSTFDRWCMPTPPLSMEGELFMGAIRGIEVSYSSLNPPPLPSHSVAQQCAGGEGECKEGRTGGGWRGCELSQDGRRHYTDIRACVRAAREINVHAIAIPLDLMSDPRYRWQHGKLYARDLR
jgi:hypothetical protein